MRRRPLRQRIWFWRPQLHWFGEDTQRIPGDTVNPNHAPRVAASTTKPSRAPQLRSIAKAIQPAFPNAAQELREIASELDEQQ